MKALLALLAALALAAAAHAQNVQLAGILGGKALLVVGAGAPRALAPGESAGGARVVSVGSDQAVVEVAGARQVLRLGEGPVSVGSSSAAGGAPQRLVLQADARGHFVSSGQVNHRAVQFIVDTGATTVAIGRLEAERLGVKPGEGQAVRMQTANGTTQGWRVRLDSVRAGPLEQRDVDAIITNEPMPYVLLGNSFLRAYEMTRRGDQLVLQSR